MTGVVVRSGLKTSGAGAGRFLPAAGFTLLELIVVLVLAGLIASVTMPPLYAGVEAVRAEAEERQLAELIAVLQWTVFFRQQPQRYVFAAHEMYVEGERTEKIVFDYLWFPEQTVGWNENGFADQPWLHYQSRGNEKKWSLF